MCLAFTTNSFTERCLLTLYFPVLSTLSGTSYVIFEMLLKYTDSEIDMEIV